LSGAAKYPVGARPSKGIIIIGFFLNDDSLRVLLRFSFRWGQCPILDKGLLGQDDISFIDFVDCALQFQVSAKPFLGASSLIGPIQSSEDGGKNKRSSNKFIWKNPAAASDRAAPRFDERCWEELQRIRRMLDEKKNMNKQRRAFQQREERRRRRNDDFARRISEEERSRFKKERKRLLARASKKLVAATLVQS
jgi:hypothetical protein